MDERTSERDAARWQAVLTRDAGASGSFFYAVRTTGVVCRATCPARRPKRENVEFFETIGDALAAGYRPCGRCLSRDAAIEHAIAIVAAAVEANPRAAADELAGRVGWSTSHLHRTFRDRLGITLGEYARQARGARVRGVLRSRPGATVTEALYAAGYESSHGFYREADATLGMTASTFRAGAPATAIRFALGACRLGAVLVAMTDRGVCAIELGDDPAELLAAFQRDFPAAEHLGGDTAFERHVAAVVGFLDDPGAVALGLPLDLRGTAFQRRVWQALTDVPPGATTTYAALAARLGKPGAARSVGSACGANRLAKAIPCHRVVRRDGGLGGYRWGLARKAALLDGERPG